MFNFRTPLKCFYDYECAISENDEHFLQNPIKLDCEHCICKKCIPNKKLVNCGFCGRATDRDLNVSGESKIKKEEMKNNFKELFNETKERFQRFYEKFKSD
jgi:hypothetical protein